MKTLILLGLAVAAVQAAATTFINVTFPKEAAIKAVTATASTLKEAQQGVAHEGEVKIPGILPDIAYDVKATSSNGITFQGVDLGWYDAEPPKDKAEPLDQDDRAQVEAIVGGTQDFYNKKDVLCLRGDHDRATALVRLIRDKDFYAGKGEVVWRMELWYCKNEAGGWAFVANQNKILRRERFKTVEAYEAATKTLRFVPELGGVKVEKGGPGLALKINAETLAAAPAGYPAQAKK